eukprot:gene34819-6864_t
MGDAPRCPGWVGNVTVPTTVLAALAGAGEYGNDTHKGGYTE